MSELAFELLILAHGAVIVGVVAVACWALGRVAARRATPARQATRFAAHASWVAFALYGVGVLARVVESERSTALVGGVTVLLLHGLPLLVVVFALAWAGARLFLALRPRPGAPQGER